jgi:hypothetical protein
LEEKAELSRRIAERASKRGREQLTVRYRKAIENAEEGSDTIRRLLLAGSAAPPDPVDTAVPEEEDTNLAGAERS